jgi:hypothetical protein
MVGLAQPSALWSRCLRPCCAMVCVEVWMLAAVRRGVGSVRADKEGGGGGGGRNQRNAMLSLAMQEEYSRYVCLSRLECADRVCYMRKSSSVSSMLYRKIAPHCACWCRKLELIAVGSRGRCECSGEREGVEERNGASKSECRRSDVRLSRGGVERWARGVDHGRR